MRIAIATVVLEDGTGTASWSDPDTVDGSSPEQIELDAAPKLFWAQRTAKGASPGHVSMTATAQGCTLTSSSAADDGTFRCYAVCRAADLGLQ